MKTENAHNKGGKRTGAGRKTGYRKNLEDTTVIRIPVSQKEVVSSLMDAYIKRQHHLKLRENLDPVDEFDLLTPNIPAIEFPLYQTKVPAGLPSPADDQVEDTLNPIEYLMRSPDGTFFVTIQGESMIDVGLMPGDKAVVDKNMQPDVGDIVLAMIDGEFTIKILAKQKNGMPKLLPANSSGKYSPILIVESMQFEITGTVTGSFRRFK